MRNLIAIFLFLLSASVFGQTPCHEEMIDGKYLLKLEPKTKKGKKIQLRLTVLLIDSSGIALSETKIQLIGEYGIIYDEAVTDENGKVVLTNIDNEKKFFVKVQKQELCLKEKVNYFFGAQENLEKEITIKWKKN